MIRIAVLLAILGLTAATLIIAWSGYGEVLVALHTAGWGILWTSLFHLVPLFCCVIGWQALMPGKNRPSLLFFLYILWLRASVNNLMPVARIGGEVIAVRVMIKHGIRKTSAIAATIVEVTTSVIAVFLFDIVGIGMFAYHVGATSTVLKLAIGLLFSIPVIAAMLFVQKAGFFGLLTRIFNLMFRDKWKSFAGTTAKLDHAVHTMYRRKTRVLYCLFWQLVSWTVGATEIWLALYFLGHPISAPESIMIEALIQASSSAAFAVPGALGVQEAGIVLFGHMLGLTPEIAAALAVIRRCRDLLLYIPGLIVWQVEEGRWLLKRG